MPAQRTGIGNGEAVRVVAVEMATGEITTQTLASLSGMNSNSNSLDAVSDDYNQLASEDLNLNTLENLEVLQNVDNDTTDQTSESEQVILKVDGSHLTNVVTVTQNDVSDRSQEIQVAKAGNAAELPSVASVPNANDKTSALKRQLSTPPSSNPVVTKVIITKNPLTSQPQPVPVNLNQVQLGQGQAVSMSSIVPGISILPGGQTPTKTITISPQGIVSSPGKQIIATIPSSPAKLTGIPVNKVPISPAKTPTKITMIPVTIGKSPQRIAPASIAQVSMLTKSLSDSGATLTPVTVVTNSGTRPTMITMSPSKVFKQGTVIQQKTGHIQIQPNQTIAINKSQLIQQSSGLRPITISNVHQVQGSKFQYVRLVTPSSQVNPSVKTAIPMTSIVQAKNIVATTTSTQPSAPQIKITLPVTGPQLMPKPVVNQNTQSVQRILLPAPSNTTTQQSTITLSAATAPTTLAQIRPSFQTNQLPPGTTILSGSDAPQNVQGFALVPASYVAQIQQQIQTKPQTATPQTPQPTLVRQEFIPIASNDPNISANAMARGVPINGTSIEPTGARPRKPCNCTKSQCLKLYCDCFANGEFCHNCNCNNCANNLEHEEERSRAIKSCLDRNPMAFHPKIGKGKGKDGERDRRHNKGCNCKRSGCLKNYCECYEAKIMCSSTCKCIGCKNFEESPERKTLMHLADAAEVRVQQQTAAKSKLSSQISGIPSRPPVSSATGERLPYTFITAEVAEATCACLLAQAEEADKIKMPPVVQERMVIEEFGRCLLQIIDSANRTKGLLSRGSSDKQPD